VRRGFGLLAGDPLIPEDRLDQPRALRPFLHGHVYFLRESLSKMCRVHQMNLPPATRLRIWRLHPDTGEDCEFGDTGIKVPYRPFCGCMGVAPPRGVQLEDGRAWTGGQPWAAEPH
jgi:hypothetical protein